jgi:hypothetical protein
MDIMSVFSTVSNVMIIGDKMGNIVRASAVALKQGDWTLERGK